MDTRKLFFVFSAQDTVLPLKLVTIERFIFLVITQYCFPNFIAKFNYIKCKTQLETTTRTTQFEFGEKELERCHSELTNPCSLSVCSCWVCGHFTEMTTRQVFQMRPGQIRERARAGAGKENPIQFFIVVAVTVVASSLLACCLHGMNED